MTRYRCAACGNLTRFDVTATRTTRAFHHYTVGGQLRVEDEVVVDESVSEVACRWCGHGGAVEVIAEPSEIPDEATAGAVAPDGPSRSAAAPSS